MGNSLRLKLVLLIGSLSFLLLLEMYQNNFYKEVILSEWRELTWNDFQGNGRPFTQYDAGISSKLYLETDTLDNFRAYAAQNNQKSWVRDNAKDYPELLRHEQYHFNLTEVFARKMNEFIRDKPEADATVYNRQLRFLSSELNRTQRAYDNQSDHGLNTGLQSIWEYKIDSMLISHASQPVSLIDQYTGAGLNMVGNHFDQSLEISDGFAVRLFETEAYDMLIKLTCYQSPEIQPVAYMENISNEYLSTGNQEIIITKTHDENNGNMRAWLESDSVNNQVTIEAWAFNQFNGYNLTVYYEDHATDSLYYASIGQSLLNSFSITQSPEYWVEKARSTSETTLMEPAGDLSLGDEGYGCMVTRQNEVNGFYGTQLITNTDSLILPYQITAVPDSLVFQSVLLAQDAVFISESQSSQHLFKISVHDLPQEPFWGRIGYLLKSDSSAGCYQFYNQSVPIYVGGR